MCYVFKGYYYNTHDIEYVNNNDTSQITIMKHIPRCI